jgi:lysine 6-dehydrogenase
MKASPDSLCCLPTGSRAGSPAAKAIGPNVRPLQLDVRDGESLRSALHECEVVVSAVSYSVNESVTRAAIEAGVHMCDLGGNNDVVDRQLRLDAEAQARNVTIVPNCGLAPGLINVLAIPVEAFDSWMRYTCVSAGSPSIHVRHCSTRSSSRRRPINDILSQRKSENGELRTVPSMTGLEELTFPPRTDAWSILHVRRAFTLTRT